jgi:WD40 repeat protein
VQKLTDNDAFSFFRSLRTIQFCFSYCCQKAGKPRILIFTLVASFIDDKLEALHHFGREKYKGSLSASALLRIFFSCKLVRPHSVLQCVFAIDMASSAATLVECSDQPLDFSFHPSLPYLLTAGLVDGTVEVHDVRELLELEANGKNATSMAQSDSDDEGPDTLVSSTDLHTQLMPCKVSETGSKQASCRTVTFSHDGQHIYSGGTAGDVACMDASRAGIFSSSGPSPVLWKVPNASFGKAPLHVLHEFTSVAASRSVMATGDESGCVRLWDTRLMGSSTASKGMLPAGCVQQWKEHNDYVSAFETSSDGFTLLASSADCTMSIYDLRMAQQGETDKTKVVRRSDDQEDELLSLLVMKRGKKVVAGTGEGVLAVWSWGTWGDVSDRFPGHPASIDALLKVDEDTLLTGSSDGLIRVVQIHPDKLLGVLGDHDGFPIEKLYFNADKSSVGSATHDRIIRLWDARVLQEDFENCDDTGVQSDIKMDAAVLAQQQYKSGQGSDEEWDDMDEEMDDGEMDERDDEDSDDSDDDDDEGKPENKNDKRAGRLKTPNEKFFEDL